MQNAEPRSLDRWACSVIPSAEGQRDHKEVHVPEVFSVHEYASTVGPTLEEETHRVVRKGRHHSAAMADRPHSHLRDHVSQASGAEPAASLASVAEKTFDTVVKETNLPLKERRPSISKHVKPSEAVLKLGGTWRSYDGTVSNYFSKPGRGGRLCVPRGKKKRPRAVHFSNWQPIEVRLVGDEGYRWLLRV